MLNKLLILSTAVTITFNTMAEDLLRLIPERYLERIASEVSGTSAKRNLDQVTLYHRMRASKEFNQAAGHIMSQLRAYGYQNAEILKFPADGTTMIGTQKSRLAWNVKFAELWELDKDNHGWHQVRRLANWESRPLTLAQDSDATDLSANLIDVGAGTSTSDYKGKRIRGKIVLTSSQPSAVEKLAIVKYGAVGVLSYAANQKSAWWRSDDTLVRWGHLSSFRNYNAFGFMITLAEARNLKKRLQGGENIRLHAKIDARREKGDYRIVTATIDGSDPQHSDDEIVFSCHLDHPRPGANDNASGCVAILEVARALKKLVLTGQIPAPRRTIRFIWPAEIEASIILLTSRPDIASNIKHLIHMDMVGGGPVTKAVFRVSRGPSSVADISGEISDAIVDFVNEHTLRYADGLETPFPLTSTEGGREPLLAQKEWLSLGSDHDVFASGSWSIPITYLHDWPDRYIHTTKDVAANIDPTKLKRAAFIGLVQGIVLASLSESETDEESEILSDMLTAKIVQRTAQILSRSSTLDEEQAKAISRGHWAQELQIIDSIKRVLPSVDMDRFRLLTKNLLTILNPGNLIPSGVIYQRNHAIKGTMHGFGYSYIEDKLGLRRYGKLSLLKEKLGDEKSYEALNLVNGKRSFSEIHDRLIYQFGKTSSKALAEYLTALRDIKVISSIDNS